MQQDVINMLNKYFEKLRFCFVNSTFIFGRSEPAVELKVDDKHTLLIATPKDEKVFLLKQ